MSKMAPVLPGMRTGWPRGSAPVTSDNKEVKNPSLTLNRQVNLYPLTNYTFGTKGKSNMYSECLQCDFRKAAILWYVECGVCSF